MNRTEKGSGMGIMQRLQVLPLAALILLVTVAQAQAQSLLTHHVRPDVTTGSAKFLSRVPGTETLQIDMVLPLRDQAGLDKFLQDVYDPTSSSYHHFLTPQQFTERFGPTQRDYDTAVGYLKSYGLKVVGGTRDGMDIQAGGSITSIEAAFNVYMGRYQHPTENRTFYAPDREPVVGLPFAIWHISGLDNYSIPHPAGLHRKPSSSSNATTGSGPSASYLGSDMRAAYYGGPMTGAGQNLGLLEYEGTDLADLNTYFTNAKQTNNVPITLLSTDGTSTSCAAPGCDDTEQTLDMTQAIGMAPGLASLVVYIGSTDSAMISAMTTHNPLPTTIGCSWGWTPADPTTLNPYFQKMAAQGQNFFAASGDSSTWSSRNEAWPADNAYVVSVGGSDLNTTGAGGAWGSETAWSDSGGGISPDGIAIPAWQQLSGVINSSNKGSTTLRNGPDVAANANFTYYVCADQTTCTANEYGGTSFAAPLWAGYIALANEQALLNGATSTIGFINPTLYAIGSAGGSNYAAAFHDITSGTSGSYSAVTGYDLVTGWGSMNGAGLINALVGASTTPTFTVSASPASVSVLQGNSGGSTITVNFLNGFSSTVALSASGGPAGLGLGLSPTSISASGGTSALTITVPSNATTGTYPITVTGIGGSVTQTTTVSLTINGPANFTIGASPTSLSVAEGSRGTSTITTAATGSFNSSIALSASGQPSGVTVSFSRSTISAPGSGTSTATFTVSSSAAGGTYPITITGTGGGITNTTTVNLTVTVPSSFGVSASPNAVTVSRGSSGTSNITTTVAGGFNAAVTLSASGQESGVTVGFNPSTIAAPGAGSSVVTFTVSSGARTGTRSVTISAKSGGTTHTTSISVTVK